MLVVLVLHALVWVAELVIFFAAVPAFTSLQSCSIAMSRGLLILLSRHRRVLEVSTAFVHCFRQKLMEKLLPLRVRLMRSSVPLPHELRLLVLVLKVTFDLMRMGACVGCLLGPHCLLAHVALHVVLHIPVLISGLYLDILFLILEHQRR